MCSRLALRPVAPDCCFGRVVHSVAVASVHHFEGTKTPFVAAWVYTIDFVSRVVRNHHHPKTRLEVYSTLTIEVVVHFESPLTFLTMRCLPFLNGVLEELWRVSAVILNPLEVTMYDLAGIVRACELGVTVMSIASGVKANDLAGNVRALGARANDLAETVRACELGVAVISIAWRVRVHGGAGSVRASGARHSVSIVWAFEEIFLIVLLQHQCTNPRHVRAPPSWRAYTHLGARIYTCLGAKNAGAPETT